jgi:hypothetical protein
MSTYLIAFVVSDFTCTEGEDLEPGVAYAVCSRDEAKDTREIAVEVGPKLTKVLEEFTGIKYSESTITKMDQFAIPDFSAGAMENWGLLTYRSLPSFSLTPDTSLFLQRNWLVVGRERFFQFVQTETGERRLARDSPHVVWKLGDNPLVV